VINAAGVVRCTYDASNIGDTYLSDITLTDDAGTPGDSSDDVTVTSADCLGLAGPLAPGGMVQRTLTPGLGDEPSGEPQQGGDQDVGDRSRRTGAFVSNRYSPDPQH